MPEISRFYGLRITMNYNEHLPPHFHVEYAEYEGKSKSRPAKSSTAACRVARVQWRVNGPLYIAPSWKKTGGCAG